jgi:DNA-binding MarR family transcriptional regulator
MSSRGPPTMSRVPKKFVKRALCPLITYSTPKSQPSENSLAREAADNILAQALIFWTLDSRESNFAVMKQLARRPARRFDSPQQETYLALWRTYDRLRSLEDVLFAEFDLTAQQYNLLRLLRASHPDAVPTLSLVGQLISRAPNVTHMLDYLEEREFIDRRRSTEDRRAVLVKITNSGLAVLDRIAEPLKECHERQLGHMTASELKQLRILLHKIRLPHEPGNSPWK